MENDLDGAYLRPNGVHPRFDSLDAGEVEWSHQCFAGDGGELRRYTVELLTVAAYENDPRPGPAQRLGHPSAEAPAGAGDHGGPAIEPEAIEHLQTTVVSHIAPP
jgi:hypothetical protein